MNKILMGLVLLAMTGAVQAKPAFTAVDYSGIYDCAGNDAHTGKYEGKVTLALKPQHSSGAYGSYDFKLEVPGFGTYLGHAAGNGNHLAMYFALANSKDYGTGIAVMKKNSQGKLSFHKFYYEPEYEGGNTGFEDCVKR